MSTRCKKEGFIRRIRVAECLNYSSKVTFYGADVLIESVISECAQCAMEFLKEIDLLIISLEILSVSIFDHLLDDSTLKPMF